MTTAMGAMKDEREEEKLETKDEEKVKMEEKEDPFNRLPKEVILMIFDKLCSSTQCIKTLCCYSMVSKRFASLLFQTPINTITIPTNPSESLTEENDINPIILTSYQQALYNFLSNFISIQTLHLQLSYPTTTNSHYYGCSYPIVKWRADIRLFNCYFIFLFAKERGPSYWSPMAIDCATNWCLQLSCQKFQVLARGYRSLWSILGKNNKIMVHRVVITDPHTPGGSIVLGEDHIAEMKNVSVEDASPHADGILEISAKCWIMMPERHLEKVDKLVIMRNCDSTEVLELIVRKAFEGEDEDLVNHLAEMVRLKPTYGFQ